MAGFLLLLYIEKSVSIYYNALGFKIPAERNLSLALCLTTVPKALRETTEPYPFVWRFGNTC